MVTEKPVYQRFPKAPLERRAYAFLIDFVAVWLLSSMLGGAGIFRWLVFMIAWLALRVVAVEKNQGQSLGLWAFDLKVIEYRFDRPLFADLITLMKREVLLGGLALLATIGLNIGFRNGLSLLILISPLLADGGVALADERLNQAFHDRFAGTIIIQSRRGFSLDLRIKKKYWLS